MVQKIGSKRSYDNSGHMEVHRYDGGSWTQIGDDIVGPSNGYAFRTTLSADGRTVAIGSSVAGRVQVYHNVNNVWTPVGEGFTGEIGEAVSLSADGSDRATGEDGNMIRNRARADSRGSSTVTLSTAAAVLAASAAAVLAASAAAVLAASAAATAPGDAA